MARYKCCGKVISSSVPQPPENTNKRMKSMLVLSTVLSLASHHTSAQRQTHAAGRAGRVAAQEVLTKSDCTSSTCKNCLSDCNGCNSCPLCSLITAACSGKGSVPVSFGLCIC